MEGYEQVRSLQRQRKYKEALEILFCVQDGDCCYFLAYLYQNGYWGLPEDITQRDVWLQKGSLLGHDRCKLKMQQLKFSYHHQLFYNGNDPFCKAMVFHSRGEYRQALEQCIQAMDLGDDFACKELLTNMWLRVDLVDRTLCMKMGMEMGNIESFHFYGVQLFNDKNPKCVDYLRISAEQGHIYSIQYLILYFMYVNDVGKAYNWYKVEPKKCNRLCLAPRTIIRLCNTGICQKACYHLLMIRNFRESILSVIPKDVVRLLAKILWNTKEEACWEPNNRVSPAILRKKRRIKKSI